MKGLTSAALAGIATLVLSGACGCRRGSATAQDSEWWRLEANRIEVAHKVELQRLRLEKIELREGGHAEQEAEFQRGAALRDRLLARVDELKREIATRSAKLEDLRGRWVSASREAALGRSFASFQGIGSRSFQNVVITRVTDIGIEFRHATGIARLAASDLTAEQRDAFGLEADASGQALDDERIAARAYATWVDRSVAKVVAEEEESPSAVDAPPPVREPLLADASPHFRSSLRSEPRSLGNSRLLNPGYSRSRDRDEYGSNFYYAAPAYGTTFYATGNGFQNIRVPSANWSFTPNNPCVPTYVRPFNSTTIP